MSNFSEVSKKYVCSVLKSLTFCRSDHISWDSLERVSLIRLLNGLQDAFVYSEADGDWEQSQADVGEDAHDAAERQGEEEQQGGAEHHGRALHIAPVEEIHDCRRRKRMVSVNHPQRRDWAGF